MEINKEKLLTDCERERLVESFEYLKRRDRLVFEMLLNLGMRGAELRDIRMSDIDLLVGSIFVRGKKNSRSRLFPIPTKIRVELCEYMKVREGREFLFDLSASGLKYLWYKVRPTPNKGVHSLRHTFAVAHYKKFKDVALLQMALGHCNIANTMIYVNFVDGSERLRNTLSGDLYAV